MAGWQADLAGVVMLGSNTGRHLCCMRQCQCRSRLDIYLGSVCGFSVLFCVDFAMEQHIWLVR